MKKRTISMTGAVLLALAAFISCSKSEEAPVKEATEFSNASNNLEFIINGKPVDNATVEYIPSATDVKKATVKISRADFNLKDLKIPYEMPEGEYMVPSYILPGNKEVSVDLDLDIDGEIAMFKKTGVATGIPCSYEFEGTVSKDKFIARLVGKVEKCEVSGSWKSDPSSPLILEMKFKEDTTGYVDGFTKADAAMLSWGLAIVKPALEKYLAGVFNGFNFNEDGSMNINYMGDDGKWVQSSRYHMLYYHKDNGVVMVYANMCEIVKDWSVTKAAEPDWTELLKRSFLAMQLLASKGLICNCSKTGDAMSFFLGTAEVSSIMQMIAQFISVEGLLEYMIDLLPDEYKPWGRPIAEALCKCPRNIAEAKLGVGLAFIPQ